LDGVLDEVRAAYRDVDNVRALLQEIEAGYPSAQ
jgi:hypothetical protein